MSSHILLLHFATMLNGSEVTDTDSSNGYSNVASLRCGLGGVKWLDGFTSDHPATIITMKGMN